MKKKLLLMLAALMCVSLCACSGNNTAGDQAEIEKDSTVDTQLIIDTVNKELNSEEFSNWQSLYENFTGNKPSKTPTVTNVTHYQIEDFDGAKMDCYLVNVSADFAHWVNEEAEQGSVDENLYIFIDIATKTSYDSISTDAVNGEDDTTTEEGRATYLLWVYANIQEGFNEGPFLNDTEKVTEITETDLEVINSNLGKTNSDVNQTTEKDETDTTEESFTPNPPAEEETTTPENMSVKEMKKYYDPEKIVGTPRVDFIRSEYCYKDKDIEFVYLERPSIRYTISYDKRLVRFTEYMCILCDNNTPDDEKDDIIAYIFTTDSGDPNTTEEGFTPTQTTDQKDTQEDVNASDMTVEEMRKYYDTEKYVGTPRLEIGIIKYNKVFDYTEIWTDTSSPMIENTYKNKADKSYYCILCDNNTPDDYTDDVVAYIFTTPIE